MPNLLIVEDDKYLNKLMSDRFAQAGFDVTSVLDGEEAWQELINNHFEVLILDMLLPKLMGAALLSRINESDQLSSLRKFAISGIYKDPQQIEELTRLHGLESYWTKPFDLEKLIEAITGKALSQEESKHRGSLSKKPIEKVFFEAYEHTFTGQMSLYLEHYTRRIHFLNGHPVAAHSTALSESFGASMVEMGIIDENIQQEVSRKMVEDNSYFGKALLDLGKLSKDELFKALRRHTYRLLVKCLQTRQGDYEFENLSKLPSHLPQLEYNPLLIILEAQRQQLPLDALLSLYQVGRSPYPRPSQRFFQLLPSLNLEPQVHEILKQLSPDQNILSLMDSLDPHTREGVVRVFYLMDNLSLLQWENEPGEQDRSLSRETTDFAKSFEANKEFSKDLQQQIFEEYMDMLNKDYYEILGVHPDCSEEELEQAYREIRSAKHPDEYGSELSGQSKRILDDILARLDEAYQTLSDPSRKQEYRQTVEQSKVDSVADSKRFLKAQEAHRLGLQQLEQSHWSKARAAFEDALVQWPQSIESQAYILYCDFQKAYKVDHDAQKADETLAELRKLGHRHPSIDLVFVLLGHGERARGKREAARDAYHKALIANPQNEEASHAIAKVASSAKKSTELTLSRKFLTKLAAYCLLLALVGFSWWQQSQLAPSETGVTELNPSLVSELAPAEKIRTKKDTANLILQPEWIEKVPDPVLKTRCHQMLELLNEYGIIVINIYDQEEGFKAICREDRLQVF